MDKSKPAITSPLPEGGWGWSRIGDEEIDALTTLLRTPETLFRYLRSHQSQCSLLEKELCERTGLKHALFVSSGTAALACALSGLGIGPGDEVIIPAYTFIATASAVIEVGAVPVIAEVTEDLWLCAEDVEKKITPYTKAVIMVHLYGVPSPIERMRELTKRHGIKLIEDACQTVGATYKGNSLGATSDAWAWSLNYYKVITCGEGGVFFCNDEDTFMRGYYHSDPGGSMPGAGQLPDYVRSGCRGTEILACVLREQLKKLDGILADLRALKGTLTGALNPGRHYRLQHVEDPSGDCAIALLLIAHSQEEALKLCEGMCAQGLEISPVHTKNTTNRHIYVNWDSIINKRGATSLNYPWGDPSYKGTVEYSLDMCPKTLDAVSRGIRIGIHLNMTERNMLEIAEAINRADLF